MKAWLQRHRLAALLVCVGIGVIAGLAGHRLTGDEGWYLAVPAAVAAGWWLVADPTQC